MSAPCKTCRFAEWDRTAAGRLSPTGTGRCTWAKTFRIAGSAQGPGTFSFGQAIDVRGGFISRKRGEEFPVQCDTYQRAGAPDEH